METNKERTMRENGWSSEYYDGYVLGGEKPLGFDTRKAGFTGDFLSGFECAQDQQAHAYVNEEE